jgi:clan AA aspartic protease
MGLVYADLEIVNSDDIALAIYGHIEKDKVRKLNVIALVDSGAYMMCVNETIKNQLGLKVITTQVAELANGHKETYEVVGPIEVNFKNRSTSCRAMVLPGDSEVLLGAIPMEDMDVIIDPRTQTLGLPPDRPYMAQKSLK